MLSTAQELGPHCFEDYDPSFLRGVQPGDVIVGEENFGGGSSREHAPVALKANGVAASSPRASHASSIAMRSTSDCRRSRFLRPWMISRLGMGSKCLWSEGSSNQRSGRTFQIKPYPQRSWRSSALAA